MAVSGHVWVWGSSLVALTRVMQVALRLVHAASPKHIWHKQIIHNLDLHLCQSTDFFIKTMCSPC